MFKILFRSLRIAPSTVNTIRMASATGCELHLVEQAMTMLRDLALIGG